MDVRRMKRPSPAFVVALIALFVALGGTAGAVVAQAVPLAKRALVADNAKKLGGQTPSQIASQASQTPGPASTAAGLVVIKTGTWSLNPGSGNNFTAMCDAGQKVLAGGWSDPGDWSSSYQSMPTGDGLGWTTFIWAHEMAPGTQNGTLYAICVK
jgi:hypothetical protein